MANRGKRATTEERILAVQLVESGQSSAQVAEMLGVGRRTVFRWHQQYRAGGIDNVHVRSGTGRPAKFSDDQLERLRSVVFGTEPRDWGLPAGLWTRPLIRTLARDRFGVDVSTVTVARALRRLGISSRLPLCSAFQQDSAEVRDWEEHTYPLLRAEAERREAAILFADEAPLAPQRRDWLLSALTLRAEQRFRVHRGKILPRHFVAFCKDLMEDTESNLILVTGVSALHTSAEVSRFVHAHADRIQLSFFPDYAHFTAVSRARPAAS
ncbi:IS630 family transposase [Streptomyces sp. HNM0574]|uniref:IS630 family transposase n=1 Tax=Streptomyces sp. HNM0574 TaxID=2714954 RepID=UPI00146C5DA9|nr:IS630 family transposase [Streptomyces sp. HNM0574]NLU70762.1 IS630 family transposase [Streptomyces sp. HNM0574]